MQIENKIEGLQYLNWRLFNELQGNLKDLSKTNYERLKKVLIKHGFSAPFHVWNNNGKFYICDGHQRLRTLTQMEQEGIKIPDTLPAVVVMAKDEKEAREKCAAMASQYGQMTSQGLYEYLTKSEIQFEDAKDLFHFPEVKFDSYEKEFLQEPNKVGQCDEDEVPEKVEPKTKLGDIYQLGNHRLMCGDSTSIDAVDKLMNGEKADITFTSPPYNVGKTPNGNENKYLNYKDDQYSDDYRKLLHDFTTNCLMVSDYVFSNIQSLSGNKTALIEYLYDLKEKYADTIIWDKETTEPAMARRVLNSQFEYIHIFSNEAKRTVGKRDFRGTLSNVFRLNSRAGKEYAKIHKATFRVELPQFFVENFTESSCLDPFGGTGTTLIACEKTNRRCFMMELDPHYCDVIVARWEKYTGKKAELTSLPSVT